ncbi:MAG: hypothetical protein KDK70_30495, partial [Myxococcales bacterium]|nr:hypothetical protein [Myxococcales bacterium]
MMEDEYYALSISIQRVADAYAVELSHRDPSSQAQVAPLRGTTSLDPTALAEAQADHARYGRALARQLWSDDAVVERFVQVETAAQASGHLLRLMIGIDPSAQELQALRWELLRHPRTDEALATSQRVLLSRFMVSRDWRPVRLRARSELVALVAVSAPEPSSLERMRLAPVDYEGEVARVQQALGGVEVRTLGGPGAPLTV